MLHLIGLGLHDVDDITVKGLRRARQCTRLYAEFYTAHLVGTDHVALEAALDRPVTVLPREDVESGALRLVKEARDADIGLLTAGDPLSATTHSDLLLRCDEAGVPWKVTHAPSILSAAAGLLGLQHYKFGRTTTLVRPEGDWSPTSPFEAIQENHDRGLHTLVLLDIQAHRDYAMHAHEALDILGDLAARLDADWFVGAQVGLVARAGGDNAFVGTGTAAELADTDPGPPLHCLVIPGALHDVEEAMWRHRAVASR